MNHVLLGVFKPISKYLSLERKADLILLHAGQSTGYLTLDALVHATELFSRNFHASCMASFSLFGAKLHD